jgi:hypothetical protein
VKLTTRKRTAEVIALPTAETRTRRRNGNKRFARYRPPVLALPFPANVERRKTKAGFDIAAALELNLDRYPSREQLLTLLFNWLRSAEELGLAARRPDYADALERAIEIVAKAASVERGIDLLRRA